MKGLAQRDSRLTRDAEDAVAVRAVGGDLEIDDIVVKVQHLAHIGAGDIAVIQDQDAVFLAAREVARLQPQLFAGAEHPVGRQAAQLAVFDVRAVRQIGIVQRRRDGGADEHVLRAGDDLQRLSADVDLTDLQVIGIGVRLERGDAPDDDVLHVRGQVLDALDLEARADHAVAQLADGDIDVYIALEPA